MNLFHKLIPVGIIRTVSFKYSSNRFLVLFSLLAAIALLLKTIFVNNLDFETLSNWVSLVIAVWAIWVIARELSTDYPFLANTSQIVFLSIALLFDFSFSIQILSFYVLILMLRIAVGTVAIKSTIGDFLIVLLLVCGFSILSKNPILIGLAGLFFIYDALVFKLYKASKYIGFLLVTAFIIQLRLYTSFEIQSITLLNILTFLSLIPAGIYTLKLKNIKSFCDKENICVDVNRCKLGFVMYIVYALSLVFFQNTQSNLYLILSINIAFLLLFCKFSLEKLKKS